MRTKEAQELNKFAATKRNTRHFTVPAGIGGISRECPAAYVSTKTCHVCGCVVRYSDDHGSWCLGCGA